MLLAVSAQLNRALERGDRRIFAYRQQSDDDAWCLVSYSLPEERRAVRHQLRRHLAWIGAGTVADGLWIAPGHLVDEVEEILVGLGVREAASFRRASEERELRTLRDRMVLVVDRWEDSIGERIELELNELSSADKIKIRDREQRLRASRPWFDAFYVWEPNEVIYPTPQFDEDRSLMDSDACLVAARRKAGAVDPFQAALNSYTAKTKDQS